MRSRAPSPTRGPIDRTDRAPLDGSRPHTHHHRSGLFIIDTKGILRQITVNDLPVGRSVDETLRLLQAFQYTDVHGEGTSGPPPPGVLARNQQNKVARRVCTRRGC